MCPCVSHEVMAVAVTRLRYCQETGGIFWAGSDSNGAKRKAGSINDRGYLKVRITVNGKSYAIYSHRLAWFFMTGKLPAGEIDHINQDKMDNRFENLRDVTKSVNQRNGVMKKTNTSGITGVFWEKRARKWRAQATVCGKKFHVGMFGSIDDAKDAVMRFRARHGFTKNHGLAI